MPRTSQAAACDTPAARATARAREIAIVLCWLAGTAVAFAWHAPAFGIADGEPATVAAFDPPPARDVADWLAVRTPPMTRDAGTVTLLHLRDPDCRCNPDADRQLQALRDRYAARGVRVVTLPVQRGEAEAPRWLAATPAAALLDADGDLLYLGPVDSPAACSGGVPLVRRAVDSALAGSPPVAQPVLGTGCFCT